MGNKRILSGIVLFLAVGILFADTSDRASRSRDARVPEQVRVNGLELDGAVTYNYNGNALNMTAEQVRNARSSGVSGTLQLRLWATSTFPVFGSTINAFVLGTYSLGQLNAGSSFFNVDTGTIPFTPPPAGTYYITMALMEYDGTQYNYQDFVVFPTQRTFGGSTGCSATSTALCLNNNRFRVTATWQSTNDAGTGTAVPLTSDTGYFWFFSSNNVEMVIKVVNGCPLNSRYWVFSGGLTNVQVSIQVTDTLTGSTRSYSNPISTAFQPIQDTSAFATCP